MGKGGQERGKEKKKRRGKKNSVETVLKTTPLAIHNCLWFCSSHWRRRPMFIGKGKAVEKERKETGRN